MFSRRLHFRPKTPPPSPPHEDGPSEDQFPLAQDTPLTVHITTESPTHGIDTFTTSEFTLSDLYGDINPEEKEGSLDASGEDLLTENFTGLTEAQVESILSETDLKALDVDLSKDDKKMTEDILDLVNEEKECFLFQGRGSVGRAGSGRGCTAVRVAPRPRSACYCYSDTPTHREVRLFSIRTCHTF
jgi:hypothetical protein